MNRELTVQHVQVVYSASFVSPAFELWGEGRKITQGLYETFSPFGVKLSDIKGESGSNAAEQVVSVSVGTEGIYKFRFDRVEMTWFRYSEELARRLPVLLAAADKWIRTAAPTVQFASHRLVYSGHCAVQPGNAEDFLKTLSRPVPKTGGVDRGTGIIFHWDVPDRKWLTQLVIDKSLIVEGGLYLALTLSTLVDVIDINAVGGDGAAYLAGVLNELGLKWSLQGRG